MTTRIAAASLQPDVRLPALSVWQRRLLALVGWITMALAFTLAIWSVHPWFVDQASHRAVSFGEQRFRLLPTAAQPGTNWTAVTLPDTWAARGQPGSGTGRYEINFNLTDNASSLGAGAWALRFDRLSFQHELRLNGHLVHAETSNAGPTGRPMAYMAQVPPSLLRAGANKLEVEVQHGSLGGLSMPMIGLASELKPGFVAQSFLSQSLPLSINIVAAAFAVFLTLIWLKRRQERGIGMLGLVCVVVSVRNCAYYVVDGPTMPPVVSAWLYFVAQTLATVLLGGFAMAISDKRWPWFEKMLWATLVSYPVLGLLAAANGMLAELRGVLYPGLLALMLPTLALLLRVPAKFRGWSALGMVAGIALSIVAGVHDYLRLQGLVSVMHTFWLPLTTPITLASYGVVLMNRFVQLVAEVEHHNALLEIKVAERTHDLMAANAAKGHFLAAASHDLRQPVAAVGLLSGLLHERLKSSDMHEMTRRLCEAVRSMESLLSGLLDLSRLEAGAIRPHLQAVSLGDLLQRIASHEVDNARQKGLELWLRPTRLVAHSDPVLLEQMVRNLIGNAVRYTQQGGVLVAVRTRGERLSIQVWDTGDGIAAIDQDRIFGDFVQLGNPERNQTKGLGLGLAIVQRASKLLAHPIGLRSRVGHGSCFTIDVPALHTARLAPPVAQVARASGDRPLQDRHIIVLDDDEAVRHALTQRLRSWGAYASPVASLDALEELLQRVMSVDLLITDHRLCDGDGFEAIDLARGSHPNLPAIMITGDTATTHLQSLLHSGVPVLHKPFQAEELLSAIESELNLSSEPATSPTCSSA